MEKPLLEYQEGTLTMDGRSVERLASEHGTPLFLFSEARLHANFEALVRGLSSLHGQSIIRYCAKANYEPVILSRLAGWGAQVAVSHQGETDLALRSGFSPDRIAFQRPILLDDEISAVIKQGISLLHAHRLEDLPLIERAAQQLDRHVRISLRLRPDWLGGCRSPLHALNRRFGIANSDVFSAVERILDSPHLTLAGLNCYMGTQQDGPDRYRPLLRRALRLAGEIRTRWKLSVEEINVGGGFPSPSLAKTGLRSLWLRFRSDPTCADTVAPPAVLEQFARHVLRFYLAEAKRVGLSPIPQLVVEPGRSLVGNAAILVTRVQAVQDRWLYLDASRNHLCESPCVVTRTILPIRQGGRDPRRVYHVSGGTLNTADLIDAYRMFPRVSPGDLLAICDAGAYSLARSSRSGCLVPAAYLLEETGGVSSIRPAEKSYNTATHRPQD